MALCRRSRQPPGAYLSKRAHYAPERYYLFYSLVAPKHSPPSLSHVVTAEHSDNFMRLSLAYRNPAWRASPPSVPYFRSTHDTLLRSCHGRCRNSRQYMGTACHCSLTCNEHPPDRAGHTARPLPVYPGRHPTIWRQGISTTPSRPAQKNPTEQKLTDPAIATAVRKLQRSNALQDIPALHPDNLPLLLSFNWCFDPVYSGPSRKANAIHIAMFLKSSIGAVKTVRNIDDLRAIGETMKLTYKTIAMENEDTDF